MLYIDITFHVEENRYELDTNIKETKIPEVLEDYLRAQIGRGKDKSTPNERESFNIRIGVDLRTDTFTTKSNTGNAGLTTGIVLVVLEKEREKLKV